MNIPKSSRYKEICNFWESSAASARDREGLKPTARDPYLQEVVESAIELRLRNDTRLLDIGCGDGTSVSRYAARVKNAVGVDYVDKYIEMARKQCSDVKNATFEVGNVLDLTSLVNRHGNFDVVTTVRCLINLPNWSTQKKAIKSIAGCVAPGGLYLASEGWQEGMDGLNALREKAGLRPMEVAKYNTMIRRQQFEREIAQYFDIDAYENLGFYLFMSRVLQPSYAAPEKARHDHPINQISAKLMSIGVGRDVFSECDYAGVYVLRRKD